MMAKRGGGCRKKQGSREAECKWRTVRYVGGGIWQNPIGFSVRSWELHPILSLPPALPFSPLLFDFVALINCLSLQGMISLYIILSLPIFAMILTILSSDKMSYVVRRGLSTLIPPKVRTQWQLAIQDSMKPSGLLYTSADYCLDCFP